MKARWYPRIALVCVLAAASTANGFQRARNVAPELRQKLASAALGLGLGLGLQGAAPALALGPQVIELSSVEYKDTGKGTGDICAGRPLIPPGEKVAKGLTPKCVLVEAVSESPAKKEISDAAVFGYVRTFTGDSAIANNPDFNSDAGQFASIPKVPAGAGKVAFEFVAVIPDAKNGDLGTLSFDSLKAISYPGGKRYAPLTDCELDSLSAACEGVQEKFMSK